MNHCRVLLVEDDKDFGRSFVAILKRSDIDAFWVQTAAEALRSVSTGSFDVIVSDVAMPEMSGLELLKHLKSQDGESLPVIMLTGFGNVREAVEAMKSGAYGYFIKPVDPEEILLTIGKACELRRLRDENRYLKEEIKELQDSEVVVESPAMLGLLREAAALAPSEVNILITGESGSGKEVIARYIHAQSRRQSAPFLAVNCQAYVATLLESELFGYRPGAFTGAASKGKKGKLELIGGGTLFLDEIGELDPSIQVKLLRVLETRRIEPVGGLQSVAVNFRLISATNQDITAALASKRFREDLYYRINTVVLHVPPLRERPEDILPLAQHFISRFSMEQKKSRKSLSPTAERFLLSYPWPGNVREIKNVMEAAVALSQGTKIERSDLRLTASTTEGLSIPGIHFSDARQTFEREYFERHYALCSGNISKMARLTDIDRKQLYRKLREYGIL